MKIRKRTAEEEDECPKPEGGSTTLYADPTNGSTVLAGGYDARRKVFESSAHDLDNRAGSRYLLHDSPTFYLRTFQQRAETMAYSQKNAAQVPLHLHPPDDNSDNRQLYHGINGSSRNNNSPSPVNSVSSPDKPSARTREPKCARCKNHNRVVRVKDHKRYCPNKYCQCYECLVVAERQRVTALQVKVRRAQDQDKKTGCSPVYDETLIRLRLRNTIARPDPVMQPILTVHPTRIPPQTNSLKCTGVNPTEHHRRLQALKQMLESFHSQGVDGALICSYIILKECDFVVEKAYDKILDARNDIGSYTGRDPSNLVSSTSSNYWSTVVPQAATSPSTALLYPQLNCLPSYYGYSFPSSAAAAAAASGGAAAAAAAAGAAAAVGSGHPLLSGAPISLCSYVPPVVQHPSSAGALNSVASSLGGPGPPPPMMEITTSGDSRGSDCRDESDREAPPGPESTRSVSVERGIGSNDDAQSDRTPPGPSTEEAAAASPTSSLVLRRSYPPTSLSFALHSTYKNRAPAIES